MIFEAVILSVLLALVRKGKLMNFAKLEIQWIYLFMVGAVVQAVLFNLADSSGSGVRLFFYEQFYWLHMMTYLLILIPLALNVRLRGFSLMALGTFMNFIPIFTNNGKMPVLVPEGYSPVFDMGHTLWVDSTRFKLLADFIFMGPPYPMPKVLSIGDLFLIVGVFWFIQYVMTTNDFDAIKS